MPEGSEQSVLRQKLARARPSVEDGSPSIRKGLQLALSKVAETNHDMILSAQASEPVQCNLIQLQATAKDDDLLLCLRTGDGSIGLVMVDLQTRAALIEVQTTGAVSSREAGDRPVTRTDSKLIEPTLKAVMEEFDNIFIPHKNRHWAIGYRPSLLLEGPRLIGLVLEDTRYKVYSVDLDLALGAKKGVLRFAFLQDRTAGAEPAQSPSDIPFSEKLRVTLDEAKIELDAVLDRIKVPLSKASSLKVGDVLHIPAEAPQRIKIVGSHGKEIAMGELGVNHGHLAVRIQTGIKAQKNPDLINSGPVKSPTVSVPKQSEDSGPLTKSVPPSLEPEVAGMDDQEVPMDSSDSDDFLNSPEIDELEPLEDMDFPPLEDLSNLAS